MTGTKRRRDYFNSFPEDIKYLVWYHFFKNHVLSELPQVTDDDTIINEISLREITLCPTCNEADITFGKGCVNWRKFFYFKYDPSYTICNNCARDKGCYCDGCSDYEYNHMVWLKPEDIYWGDENRYCEACADWNGYTTKCNMCGTYKLHLERDDMIKHKCPYEPEPNPTRWCVEYYSNGQKRYEGQLVNGRKEGFWKWWYDTGVVKNTKYYSDNKEEGESRFWHPNKQLGFRGSNIKGKLDGECIWWRENGDISSIMIFKNGNIVK